MLTLSLSDYGNIHLAESWFSWCDTYATVPLGCYKR